MPCRSWAIRLDANVRFPPIADPGRVRFRAESLQLNLLRNRQGVVHLDPQIADSALKLSVSKK